MPSTQGSLKGSEGPRSTMSTTVTGHTLFKAELTARFKVCLDMVPRSSQSASVLGSQQESITSPKPHLQYQCRNFDIARLYWLVNVLKSSRPQAKVMQFRKPDAFRSATPIATDTESDWCYGTERVGLARLQLYTEVNLVKNVFSALKLESSSPVQ